MSNIITIGYITEGKTDIRFLQNIIHRTFQEVAFDCNSEIEVFEPQVIKVNESSFIDEVLSASKQAFKEGLIVLCIHSDSDHPLDKNVFTNKINPAICAIEGLKENVCRNIVAIIPVQMTEAWMLADKVLLKSEIGTTKTDFELGFNKDAESIPDPKRIINDAIQVAFAEATRRQRIRQLTISELYQPLGQKIELKKLECLPSYMKFKANVKDAFRKLNYLTE